MSWLLAGRIATGLGEGMIAVAVYALVGRVYPPSRHARLYTLFSAAWVLPALCAPALSGLVGERYGWRWVLLGLPLVTVPAALLLLPALRTAARGTPRGARAWHSPKLSWACGAAAAALALHGAGQSGVAAGSATGLLAAACLLLILCTMRLLPPGTLRARRGLPAGLALQAASQAAFFSAEAFLPLLLVQQRGLTVGTAGLVLTAGAVMWSTGAACRGLLGRALGTQGVLATGMVLVAIGIAASMLLLLPGAPLALAALSWAVAGFGMGMVSPTLSVLTLALAPSHRHGETGAALRLSAALGTTAALAVNGALFAALLPRSPVLAFLASLAAALALALLGAAISARTAGDRAAETGVDSPTEVPDATAAHA
jgi:MFS family permease